MEYTKIEIFKDADKAIFVTVFTDEEVKKYQDLEALRFLNRVIREEVVGDA